MNNSTEIVADILREMRADSIETEEGVITFDDYADRIEVAYKRERAFLETMRKAMAEHNKRASVGNDAAMRKALERLDEHLYEDDYDGHLFFDIFGYDPKEEIRTALAEPPRNCDRYATRDAAYDAWAKRKDLSIDFDDWLFAPVLPRCATGPQQDETCTDKEN